MMRLLIGIAALSAASACASPYADIVQRLDAAPVCCASLATLPFRSLDFGQRETIELTESSPVYLFPSGKSYFVAFELPRYPGPYRIIIDSYLLGDSIDKAHMFLPVLLTLDGSYDIARTFDADLFQLRTNRLLDMGGVPRKLSGSIEIGEKTSGERYLVVLTKEELTRAWISITPPGETEKMRIRSMPVGKLLIRLERIAQ